jgi:DNA polymerase-1
MKYLKTVAQQLKKNTLCIDADLYLYRAAAAAENETDWGNDIFSLSTDLKEAKEIFTNQVENFKKELKVDQVLMCISSTTNFRKSVYKPYKSGRKKVRKPVGHAALVTWCKETYPSIVQETLEADDVMGILASDPNAQAKRIIVSDDKDMKTIPGQLYRPFDGELFEITLQEADRHFYTQCLTGDTTDGYPGLPGVGPVKANKILGSRPDWSLVQNAYTKAGLNQGEALDQARCARILRFTDWDFTNDKVKLWSPR